MEHPEDELDLGLEPLGSEHRVERRDDIPNRSLPQSPRPTPEGDRRRAWWAYLLSGHAKKIKISLNWLI